MDIAQELLKLGPAGLVCVVLFWMVTQGGKREEKKDNRIQLLENLLTESYDERVAAADRIATALHETKAALTDFLNEVRAKR